VDEHRHLIHRATVPITRCIYFVKNNIHSIHRTYGLLLFFFIKGREERGRSKPDANNRVSRDYPYLPFLQKRRIGKIYPKTLVDISTTCFAFVPNLTT